MATYFGEVLPEFSRIIADDEDETVDLKNNWKVILKWGPAIRDEIKSTGHVDCQSIIVAVDAIACMFLRDHLIPRSSKPVGVLSCGLTAAVRNTLGQREVNDNSCFLYRMASAGHQSVLVLWNHSATSVQQFTVVQELMNSFPIGGMEVVVLTSAHSSTYKCPDRGAMSDSPIVRTLSTDASTGPLPFPVLEVPNMVTGFPARVLTECQTRGISAKLHVSYVDEMTPDTINVGAFRSLLRCSPFHNIFKGTSSDGILLQTNSLQSNTTLYS